MNHYRISGIQDDSGITHWKLQKRVFIFFWKLIYKGSLECCYAEIELLESNRRAD